LSTLSLHDALPIWRRTDDRSRRRPPDRPVRLRRRPGGPAGHHRRRARLVLGGDRRGRHGAPAGGPPAALGVSRAADRTAPGRRRAPLPEGGPRPLPRGRPGITERCSGKVARMRSLYIDGAWAPSASADSLDVVNPATEEVIDTVPAGDPADVDRAVAAARAAFPAWSALPVQERRAALGKALALFSERAPDIAAAMAADMGAPLKFAAKVQAGLPLLMFSTYLDLADEVGERYFAGEEVGSSVVVREPCGVVGAITPWNYPLHQIVLKVVPALLAGNTVVLKPTEVAPLGAYAFAEVLHDAGLP